MASDPNQSIVAIVPFESPKDRAPFEKETSHESNNPNGSISKRSSDGLPTRGEPQQKQSRRESANTPPIDHEALLCDINLEPLQHVDPTPENFRPIEDRHAVVADHLCFSPALWALCVVKQEFQSQPRRDQMAAKEQLQNLKASFFAKIQAQDPSLGTPLLLCGATSRDIVFIDTQDQFVYGRNGASMTEETSYYLALQDDLFLNFMTRPKDHYLVQKYHAPVGHCHCRTTAMIALRETRDEFQAVYGRSLIEARKNWEYYWFIFVAKYHESTGDKSVDPILLCQNEKFVDNLHPFVYSTRVDYKKDDLYHRGYQKDLFIDFLPRQTSRKKPSAKDGFAQTADTRPHPDKNPQGGTDAAAHRPGTVKNVSNTNTFGYTQGCTGLPNAPANSFAAVQPSDQLPANKAPLSGVVSMLVAYEAACVQLLRDHGAASDIVWSKCRQFLLEIKLQKEVIHQRQRQVHDAALAEAFESGLGKAFEDMWKVLLNAVPEDSKPFAI